MAFFLSRSAVNCGGETTPLTVGTSCQDKMHLMEMEVTLHAGHQQQALAGRRAVGGHPSQWDIPPARLSCPGR